MKRLILGGVIALLASLVGLSIVGFIGLYEDVRVVAVASNSSNNIDPSTLDDLEIIPKYPGAVLVEDLRRKSTWRRVKLKVPTDIRTMFSFYNQALTRDGWALVSENIYTWSDPNGQVPWHLDLYLGGEAFEDGTSGTTLLINRWSTIDNLPVYPGTEQFTLKTTTGQGPKLGKLTYETNATSTKIAEFYENALPLYGWNLDARSPIDNDAQSALLFVSSRNAPNKATIQLWMRVQWHIMDDGLIQVELHTASKEIDLGDF
jgi:hypothetical protein